MGDSVCENTGGYVGYFPICGTTSVSAEACLLCRPLHILRVQSRLIRVVSLHFKDRFLQLDQDQSRSVVDTVTFVDSVDTLYTEGHLIGHNTSTSSESVFIGQQAKICHDLLKRLVENTGSPLITDVCRCDHDSDSEGDEGEDGYIAKL
ncbi:hypothetical protein MBLNU13_g03972t1 [Cladosporium sp. NU13]